MAGALVDLPNAGDRAVFDIGDESVLLMRGDDGEVRAFHNVCVHRGLRLCDETQGSGKGVTCPYHHWRFATDGTLAHVKDRTAFSDGASLPAGLKPVRCEVWAGLIWVNLDGKAEPLASYLGAVKEEVERYHLEFWSLVTDSRTEIGCNWKISTDVHNEAYHLSSLHPGLLDVVDDLGSEYRRLGIHSSLRTPIGVATTRRPNSVRPEMLIEMLVSAGVDPEAARVVEDTRGAMATAVKARLEREGLVTRSLEGARLTDNVQYFIFPNLHLNLGATALRLYRHRPAQGDGQRCHFDDIRFEPRPGPATRVSAVVEGIGGERSLGPENDADVAMALRLQRGLASSGFEAAELHPLESAIEQFHESLEHYLGKVVAPGASRPPRPEASNT